MFKEKRLNDKGYPEFKTKKGWMSYHRFIAEKKLGRRLRPNEDVHHINRNKKDFRKENLAILKRADHEWEHKNKRGLFE